MVLPAGIDATVSGVPVRILNLSAIGALFEHDERFTIPGARFEVVWNGQRASLAIRVIRSAIIGRRETRLMYQTGVQFTSTDAISDGVVASILRIGDPAPGESAKPEPKKAAALEDSWTRQISFLPRDTEDDLPYAQYRLTPAGWVKQYVDSTAQPDGGFTVRRDDKDFQILQRAFEKGDAETRRRLQQGIAAKLRR